MMKRLLMIMACATIAAPCLLSAARFHLKDFEGDWIGYGTSAGGIDGSPLNTVQPDLNPNVSQSIANITHSTLDKHGNGKFNVTVLAAWSPLDPIGGIFASFTSYLTPQIGDPSNGFITVAAPQPNARYKLDLIDPVHGTGILEIYDFPFPGGHLAQQFFAFRQHGCKVNKFISVGVNGTVTNSGFTTTTPPSGVNLTISERQD